MCLPEFAVISFAFLVSGQQSFSPPPTYVQSKYSELIGELKYRHGGGGGGCRQSRISVQYILCQIFCIICLA